jgi:hypothetical protein
MVTPYLFWTPPDLHHEVSNILHTRTPTNPVHRSPDRGRISALPEEYRTSFQDLEEVRLRQKTRLPQMTRRLATKASRWDPKESDKEVKLMAHSNALNAMQHDPTHHVKCTPMSFTVLNRTIYPLLLQRPHS